MSNPTQPWVISNLTPCLDVITIKIYGLILNIFPILQCLFLPKVYEPQITKMWQVILKLHLTEEREAAAWSERDRPTINNLADEMHDELYEDIQ